MGMYKVLLGQSVYVDIHVHSQKVHLLLVVQLSSTWTCDLAVASALVGGGGSLVHTDRRCVSMHIHLMVYNNNPAAALHVGRTMHSHDPISAFLARACHSD